MVFFFCLIGGVKTGGPDWGGGAQGHVAGPEVGEGALGGSFSPQPISPELYHFEFCYFLPLKLEGGVGQDIEWIWKGVLFTQCSKLMEPRLAGGKC